MAVAFTPGTVTQSEDLDIFLTNSQGNPADAYEITYAIYYVDPVPVETEVLIGAVGRIPEHPGLGQYYASFMIPSAATIGTYRIRWLFREFSAQPLQGVVQEFAVVASSNLITSSYNSSVLDMIRKFRIWTRDNNPDRNYRFSPPEYENNIGQYNQVFGFIWEDAEIVEYLESSLDYWNMFPPETEDYNTIDAMVTRKPVWRSAILYGAVSLAAMALMANWIKEEFSVEGKTLVTLDVEGETIQVSMEDLYEILKGDVPSKIQEAFLRGTLRVQAVCPTTGTPQMAKLGAVLQHSTPTRPICRVTLQNGATAGFTEDHGVFIRTPRGIQEIRCGDLTVDSQIICVVDGEAREVPVASITVEAPQSFTYDLSVPGPENFVLANGILAHNSYSIGGISLDLERSSKYESLKSTADARFDQAKDTKLMTVFHIRGLKQPRYAGGISKIGPSMGRGIVNHPRAFLGAW